MLTFCDPLAIAVVQPHERRFSKLFEKTKLLEKNCLKKKSRAAALLGKLCRPFIPEMFGFILD
jgi:hypothetical protein